MNKKDLIYIGVVIAGILILKETVKKVINPALENVDAGMDNVADYYVKKDMAWNEFLHNSDTLKEKYDNLMTFFGFN